MKLPRGYESIFVIDDINVVENAKNIQAKAESLGEVLVVILLNYDVANDINGYMEI
ncbi:hypothetical protein HAX54_008653, partial [Datura stramonium]|nr:hypothetical protein [Datura stramonium]